MTTESLTLLGAPLEPTRLAEYHAGPWSFAWAGGALRWLRAHGVEVIRGIEFLSRDPDWGVHPLMTTYERVEADGDRLAIRYGARAAPGCPRLSAEAELVVERDELRYTVLAVAEETVRTARTGFVVLHPIAGFAGAMVEASLSDGSARSVRIPELVSPAQPLRDFDRLAFAMPGAGRVEVRLEGELPFEMEDQRNWTDASFKTYYRPLALPWPYTIEAGTRVEQTIRVRLLPGSATAPSARAAPGVLELPTPGPAPERALVWLAADPEPASRDLLARLRPDRLEAHVDLRGEATGRARQAAALARDVGAALHLRLILPDEGDVREELAAVASAAGEVAGVLALPAAFLKSYQPDGAWPTTRSSAEALQAVRGAFPRAATAEGMLTYFTEVNRHPPGAGADAVVFGTAAIVHAADDVSVMETLEALPSVFASARAHAAGRPVDIGLASIGLWTNPYGAALVPNPDWRRTPLGDRDPRIRGLYGAAWLVGYVAHAAAAQLRSVGVGTVSGVLGLLPSAEDADWRAAHPGARLRPLWHAVAGIGMLGGGVSARPPLRRGDVAILAGDGRALVANTAAEPASVALAGHRIAAARLLDAAALSEALADPDWLAGPAAPCDGRLELGPYAVALAELERT